MAQSKFGFCPGRGAVWFSALDWGSRGRRFESCRPDFYYVYASGRIEIKYTLLGDANLDGVVNGSDFSILAANFGLGNTNWDQGNFLYTSSVNGSDFSALAANFGQGDSGADVPVSQADIDALDSFAIANGLPLPTFAAVPEPASAALLLVAASGLFLPRRRR